MDDRGMPTGGAELFTVTLRFLLELAGIAAAAWWGIQTGTEDLTRAILAVGAAGLLIVIWALVVAPKARNGIPPRTRWLIGSGVLLLAALGMAVVGATIAAIRFAALILIDTMLMLRMDGTPQVARDRDAG